jgi:hypothetical protein
LEVSVAWRMATVGSRTAAAINRARTIFFEIFHLSNEHSVNNHTEAQRDNPTVLNTPFKKI